jgi:beta-galactosidase
MEVKQMEQQALHFGPLFCSSITTDFVHPASDLSHYKLIVIPNLYQVTAENAENIIRYVENGGTLVMSFFSGIADENDHIWLGGYPALFKKMLGITVEEFAPAVGDEKFSVRFNDGSETVSDLWSEVIHLEGAEVLAKFTAGFCADKPAITKHRYGKGTAYYIGTRLSLEDMQRIFASIFTTAGVKPVLPAPIGVDVVLRKGEHSFLCIMNNLQETVTLDLQNYAGTDLLTGERSEKTVTLKSYDVRIIRLQRDL